SHSAFNSGSIPHAARVDKTRVGSPRSLHSTPATLITARSFRPPRQDVMRKVHFWNFRIYFEDRSSFEGRAKGRTDGSKQLVSFRRRPLRHLQESVNSAHHNETVPQTTALH